MTKKASINAGPDNFEFDLISEFKGYNSSKDKTNLDPAFMIRGSKNVYKKLSGTIASRPGLARRGTADATVAGVKSSFEWQTSLNETRVVRVANAKFQVESNIADGSTYVWYDLMTALTLTRFVFAPWWDNTDKKDKLIFAMGDSNEYSWSGGITKVSGGTVNTITKLDSSTTFAQDGFASTGTITINGIDYTYTGGTGTSTLTGTSDASALTSGLVGIAKVVTTSNKPASGFNNDFIKVIGNRLHCGSYTSRLIYISNSTDFSDFSVPSPRTAGSPELLTLDNTAKAISVRGGNASIFAGTADLYTVSYTDLTVGGTATQQTNVDKKVGASLSGALAHEFVDTTADDIIWLDQGQHLRDYGSFTDSFTTKTPTLSLPIQDELSDEDFTGGHLRIIGNPKLGEVTYITAPNSGRDYMYVVREDVNSIGQIVTERFWQPPQVRNITRFAVIDGVIFGHSNANPQIYQVWDTLQWHDDSPSDESLPYDCIARFAYRSNGRRQGQWTFDKAYYEGYMTEGSEVGTNIYYDYQGSTNIQSPFINSTASPATFYSGLSAPSIGDASLGDNPLGDGLSEEANDQELLPKYRKITDLNPTDCFEYAQEVYSTAVDSRWELLALGVNPSISENQAVHIRK